MRYEQMRKVRRLKAGQSPHQLGAMERDFAQITKQRNASTSSTIEPEQPEVQARFIYKHTKKVAAMQDISLNRWKIVRNQK